MFSKIRYVMKTVLSWGVENCKWQATPILEILTVDFFHASLRT